ncbi:MAG: ABC transporter ATP-binding protein [Chloroflexota bacterium]|nr:ABC transporter ATP-binding protein [Chloroflexota bacterium]|tara:strand:- start:4710 stop:5432 length:723 start_codon:yes stop_codon:yes gene_type:complete
MEKILEVNNISGGYGSIQILNGIDLTVYESEFVTIIGPNGCGKSTFIKVIFGIANLYQGDIIYRNEDITGMRADSLVKKGIGYVPQTDNVFPSLTVEENLQMGGLDLTKPEIDERIEQVYEIFPNIKEKPFHLAESLSGGERQMLAISRVLISNPSFIMFDEPTAALSPKFREMIIEKISDLRKIGITVLIVEQNARLSLAMSDRGYIFSNGAVVHTSDAKNILEDENIGNYFLGGKNND